MKLEDQFSSLAPSQRLKELGVKQESLFYWITNGAGESKIFINRELCGNFVESYSAFTVAELGEMLPRFVNSLPLKFAMKGTVIVLLDKKGDWLWQAEATTEADARAKMLIYLIEKGLVKP